MSLYGIINNFTSAGLRYYQLILLKCFYVWPYICQCDVVLAVVVILNMQMFNIKNAIFWDVMPCGSSQILCAWILLSCLYMCKLFPTFYLCFL
jgi:hypothetical protein